MLICENCSRKFSKDEDFLTSTSGWVVDDTQHLHFRCECGAPHSIAQGEYDWYSPKVGLSEESASVFNQLAGKMQLPHLPASIFKIQQVLLDPESSAAMIGQELRSDPLLAVEVVNQANNAKVVSGESIDSIEHAVTYIGRDKVSELLMVASLKSFEFRTKKFSQEEYWQMAELTGVIAEHIAKSHFSEQSLDQAYLAGVFCNLGKIVSALCFPIAADRVSMTIHDRSSLSTWSKAEADFKLPKHEILGEIACRFWGLPGYAIDANRLHHNESSLLKKKFGLNHVIAIANQLTHWVMLRPHLMDESFLYAIAAHGGLEKGAIEALANRAKHWHEVKLAS